MLLAAFLIGSGIAIAQPSPTLNSGPYRTNDASKDGIAYKYVLEGTCLPGQDVWFKADWWSFYDSMTRQAYIVGNHWYVELPATEWDGPLRVPFTIEVIESGDVVSQTNYISWFDATIPAFTDVPVNDWELYLATWYCSRQGLIYGYDDVGTTQGRFGTTDSLLKRHVALVAQRAGLAPPDWFDNYSVATRGDVHEALPELQFFEDRWGEELLRGQFARLLLRNTDID